MNFLRSAYALAQSDVGQAIIQRTTETVASTFKPSQRPPDSLVYELAKQELTALKFDAGNANEYLRTTTDANGTVLVVAETSTVVGHYTDQDLGAQVPRYINTVLTMDPVSKFDKKILNERLNWIIRRQSPWTPLHIAAAIGAEKSFNEFFPSSPSDHLHSPDGLPLLNIALLFGNLKIAEKILQSGSLISPADGEGQNALHIAALSEENISPFLERASDFAKAVQGRNKQGFNPLQIAVLKGNIKGTEILCRHAGSYHFAQPEQNPMSYFLLGIDAPTENQMKCLSLIMQGNHGKLFIEQVDPQELTVFHHKLHVLVANKLLSYGVLDLKQLKSSISPLVYAIRRKELPSVICYASYGIEVTCDVMAEAVKVGDVNIMRFLLCISNAVPTPTTSGLSKSVYVKLVDELSAAPDSRSLNELELQMNKLAIDSSKAVPLRSICLCLDGGGVKGLAIIQVLLEIQRNCRHFLQYCRIMSGTSTGSILTVFLAKQANRDPDHFMESLRTIQFTYLRLLNNVFSGFRPYSADALVSALKVVFGDTSMSHLSNDVTALVSAAYIQRNPPSLHWMTNDGNVPRNPEQPKWTLPEQLPVWKAVRCSSAAPTYFPCVENTYVDGGLIANNPTVDTLTVLRQIQFAHQTEQKYNIGAVVSLGCGQSAAKAVRTGTDLNLSSFSSMIDSISAMNTLKELLLEQLTSPDETAVRRSFALSNAMGVPFWRLTPPLKISIELDQTDPVQLVELMWEAKKYASRSSALAELTSFVNSRTSSSQ